MTDITHGPDGLTAADDFGPLRGGKTALRHFLENPVGHEEPGRAPQRPRAFCAQRVAHRFNVNKEKQVV